MTRSPARLTRALRAAREATGTEQDVERLRVRLEAKLAAATDFTESTAALHETAPRLGMLSSKAWVLWLTAAAGVGALAYLVATRQNAPVLTAAERAPVSAPAIDRAARSAQPAGPGATTLAPAVETQAEVPAAAAPRALANGSESRTPRGPKPDAAALRATKLSAADRAAASRATRAQADLDAEVALVTRAQNLLARQPNEALALVTEHERVFPHGLLAQERDVLRIDAERALGHRARALEHARVFVAQFPDSPQARALKQWLAAQDYAASLHNAQPVPVLTP